MSLWRRRLHYKKKRLRRFTAVLDICFFFFSSFFPHFYSLSLKKRYREKKWEGWGGEGGSYSGSKLYAAMPMSMSIWKIWIFDAGLLHSRRYSSLNVADELWKQLLYLQSSFSRNGKYKSAMYYLEPKKPAKKGVSVWERRLYFDRPSKCSVLRSFRSIRSDSASHQVIFNPKVMATFWCLVCLFFCVKLNIKINMVRSIKSSGKCHSPAPHPPPSSREKKFVVIHQLYVSFKPRIGRAALAKSQ